VRRDNQDHRDVVQQHIDTLADRLEEAFRVARENNQSGREKHKEQYDKGTKLIIFQPGEMIYLREMVKGRRGCPKFRLRWKGPYEVLRRLSDLNYLVRVTRNKEIVVNVNKMKRCHKSVPMVPPSRGGVATPVVDEEIRHETDAEVISPVPRDQSDNHGSLLPASPEIVGEEEEDQTNDPTWNPDRQPEVRVT
jgi:hypothetical protein